MSGRDIISKTGYCLSSLILIFLGLCSIPHSKATKEVIISGKCSKFYENTIIESKEAPWWNQGPDTCHICNSINNKKSWFITKFLNTNNAELVNVDIQVSFTDCPECKNQHLKIFAVHENVHKQNIDKSEMIAKLNKSKFLKEIKNEKSGKTKTHNLQFASHSSGVSIVFLAEGACLMVSNIEVSSFICENTSVQGVHLPRSVSPACGSRMVNSSCFNDAVPSNERVFGICGSDGEWKFVTPCVCKEGFTLGSKGCRASCQDKSRQCRVYSDQGFCASNHVLYDSMKKNCPNACGFCNGTEISGGPTKNAPCQDKNRYCQNYSDGGYCVSSHKYHKYMKIYCRKTCRFCGVAAPCADTHSRCPRWKSYCKSNEYVKRNCKRACGTC